MVSQLIKCDVSRLSNAITGIHPTIIVHVKFETLIPFLNHYRIFTATEMEYFNNKFNSTADKVNILIQWLSTKDHDGIHNFVKALNEADEHSGHKVILEKLHGTMFPVTTV